MTTELLLKRAEDVAARLSATSECAEERAGLRDTLHQLMDELKAQGARIPAHLSRFDMEMADEEVEDRFDNMPV